MVVLSLIGDDEHRRVVQRSLNMLPRRASSDATALVVTPVARKRRKRKLQMRNRSTEIVNSLSRLSDERTPMFPTGFC